jgi:hypothetical protein
LNGSYGGFFDPAGLQVSHHLGVFGSFTGCGLVNDGGGWGGGAGCIFGHGCS